MPSTMLADRDWLRDHGYTVHHNPSLHGLIIEDFELPAGWEPQTTDVLLRYLTAGPLHHARVYLPEEARYTEGDVQHYTKKGPDGWRWYCIHRSIDDPARIEIEDVFRLFMASLNHPEEDLPVVKVGEATPEQVATDPAVRDILPF
jgi:hypothetical protein